MVYTQYSVHTSRPTILYLTARITLFYLIVLILLLMFYYYIMLIIIYLLLLLLLLLLLTFQTLKIIHVRHYLSFTPWGCNPRPAATFVISVPTIKSTQ